MLDELINSVHNVIRNLHRAHPDARKRINTLRIIMSYEAHSACMVGVHGQVSQEVYDFCNLNKVLGVPVLRSQDTTQSYIITREL